MVGAAQAELAASAGEVGFERHPVADRNAPGARRVGADFGDAPHRLVPRDDGVAHDALGGEVAPVLVDVGAAETARLDPEQRLLGPDRRHLVLVGLDPPVRDLDHDPGFHAASAGRTRRAISAPRSRSTRAMSYWLWRPIQNEAPLPK